MSNFSDEQRDALLAFGHHVVSAMRDLGAALTRLHRPLRKLTLMIEPRRAPCLTCDGTIVAYDWPRDYAWCRCRNRWTFEAIIRGNSYHFPTPRFPVELPNHVHVGVVSDHWQVPPRPLAVDDLYKLRRHIQERPWIP